MIPGVIAQEYGVRPKGTLVVRHLVDDEQVLTPIVSSDLDQLLFVGDVVYDLDQITITELPQVLTNDGLFAPFLSPETIFQARVTQDRILLPQLYTANDTIFLPDIRVPGFLLPQLHSDFEVIFPTPLILDRGMLRASAAFVEIDEVFAPALSAPLTLSPVLYVDPADLFYTPMMRAAIGPPLLLHDDAVFAFRSTGSGYLPSFVIDSARPTTPLASLDAPPANVVLSSNNLTATHNPALNYSGARSSLSMATGKFYFEVTVGTLTGPRDCVGIAFSTTSYQDIAQLTNTIALYSNYDVDGSYGNGRGAVITDGLWYCQFGTLIPGDVVSVAVNLDDHLIWFRVNGGPWNNDQYGPDDFFDQDPATGVGRIPLDYGAVLSFAPIVGFGGVAGTFGTGTVGDSVTFNFGQTAFQYDLPTGFTLWQVPSPFPASDSADRFGQAVIASPATLDGVTTNVIMSGGNLVASKDLANPEGMAASASGQNWGKFYFEVTVASSHATQDCIGLLGNVTFPAGAFIDGGYAAIVYPNTGNALINAEGQNTGRSLGRNLVAGDVVGVAVDLTEQNIYYGGTIWFRLNGAAWNNNLAADPTTRVGGVPLGGQNYNRQWVPAVGFGAFSTVSNDNFVANFGQNPFQATRPRDFGLWPNKNLGVVQALLPGPMANDDAFPTLLIDQAVKVLFHIDRFNDNIVSEFIFPTQIVGGSLFIAPNAVVPSDDNIFPSGFYGAFEGVNSVNVTVSNSNRTATLSTTPVTNVGARSANYRNTGKFYFEATWTQATASGNNSVGLLMSGGTLVDINTGNTKNCAVVFRGGSVYANNAFAGAVNGAFVTGDTVGIAVDLGAHRIWFRRNGTNWNNSSTANPANGVGGFLIANGVYAPVASFSNGNIGDSWTYNFGQTAFINTPPASFLLGWPGGLGAAPLDPILVPNDDVLPPQNIGLFHRTFPVTTVVPSDDDIPAPTLVGGNPAYPTFDGANANVTISNGGLTATHTNTTNNSGARSLSLKSSTAGKLYFEVKWDNTHGSADCCGILTAAGTFTNLVTNATQCSVIYKSGAIYCNGVNTFRNLGALTNGDVINIAVDLAAAKIWFRKNGVGNWNNNAADNPGTGANGLAITPSTTHSPAVGFGGTGTAAGDAMTVNFGNSPYNAAVPAGFGNWTA